MLDKFDLTVKQTYLSLNLATKLLNLLLAKLSRVSCPLVLSLNLQWTALCSLMSLVQAEGHAHQSTVKAYIYPNNLFHNIVSRLLDNNTDRCDLIGRFADEYLQFDDVRFNWLKNIA